jgi:protein-tyrosine phosphatase
MKKRLFLFIIVLGGIMLVSCNKKKSNKLGFSGEGIVDNVEIIRNKENKSGIIRINISGNWSLYGGNSIDNINLNQVLAEGNESGEYKLDIPANEKFYFQIITEKGSAILSERHLPMLGGFNFRDLGGIKNKDGKYTKWGKVFRADELHNLTNEDLDYLSSIPLVSIVDFRSKEEINKAPDKNPSSLKSNYAYSINPGSQSAMTDFSSFDFSGITEIQSDAFMTSLNQLLVIDSICINRYKDFFRLLQNNDDIPLLFHCTAGKDRTGMGAALFLSSLNVDEETIFKDYLTSNIYLESKYANLKKEYPQLSAFFEVKPEFLKAGFDQIKKTYGSIQNFLVNILEVDMNKMQNMYLY